MAEVDILVGGFNQAGDIANCESIKVRILNNSDLRMQSRERIGSDFRSGVRDSGKQSRFAGIRISYQPHLGDDTKLEKEIPFLARLARLRKTGGLAGGGGQR